MNIHRKIQKKIISFAQKMITRAYEKEGLTDEVLELQIQLNELRNKYDINETNDEFVQ